MFFRIKRDLTRAFNRFRHVKLTAIPALYARAFRLQRRNSQVKPQKVAPRKESLIITLTTIPSRLERIIPVLKSLIDQDIAADQIVLAVPSHSTRENAPYSDALLAALPKDVRILRCDDLGPATKLLPALKEFPNSVLVVVDDDVIYPRDFIKTLLLAHRQTPDVAFGYRGVQLKDRVDFADLHHVFATAVDIKTPVDILFGTWGYLVPPGALDDEVHDFTGHPDEVRWVDDVWISGHLAKRGIARYVMPATRFPVETPSSSRKSLTGGKNRSGTNDQVAIEEFRLCWGKVGK